MYNLLSFYIAAGVIALMIMMWLIISGRSK